METMHKSMLETGYIPGGQLIRAIQVAEFMVKGAAIVPPEADESISDELQKVAEADITSWLLADYEKKQARYRELRPDPYSQLEWELEEDSSAGVLPIEEFLGHI